MFKKFLGLSALALLVSGVSMAAGSDTDSARVNLTIQPYVDITNVTPVNLSYDPATNNSGTVSDMGVISLTANAGGLLTLGTFADLGGNGANMPTGASTLLSFDNSNFSAPASTNFSAGNTTVNFWWQVSNLTPTTAAGTGYYGIVPVTATIQ